MEVRGHFHAPVVLPHGNNYTLYPTEIFYIIHYNYTLYIIIIHYNLYIIHYTLYPTEIIIHYTHYSGGWMIPNSPSGRFGDKPLAIVGIRDTDRPAFSLATISTTLYRPNKGDTLGVENKPQKNKKTLILGNRKTCSLLFMDVSILTAIQSSA
jgi:hypothetical protein